MLDAFAVGAKLLGRLAAQVIHTVAGLRELAHNGQVALLLYGGVGRLLLRDGICRAAGFVQRDVQGVERAVGLLERCQRFRATVATLPQLGTQALELEGASHSNPHRHQGDHNKHNINSRHKLRLTNPIEHQSKPRSILPCQTQLMSNRAQTSYLCAMGAGPLALPAGADGCCDIPQALTESCQVLKYLIGRGAVENAREGI